MKYLILLILISSCFITPVYCANTTLILVVYEGGYSLTPENSISNTSLYRDIDLENYDRIDTFKNSKIELRFGNGTYVRLKGDTTVEIIPGGLFFHSGSIYIDSENSDKSINIRTKFMNIHTGNGVYSLSSDDLTPPSDNFLEILDGQLELTDYFNNHWLIMEKGYAVTNDDDYRILYFNVYPFNIIQKIRKWKRYWKFNWARMKIFEDGCERNLVKEKAVRICSNTDKLFKMDITRKIFLSLPEKKTEPLRRKKYPGKLSIEEFLKLGKKKKTKDPSIIENRNMPHRKNFRPYQTDKLNQWQKIIRN